MCIYEADSMLLPPVHRIEADDPYFHTISDGWGDALKRAFESLPNPEI
jgi:putative proteasome-type protease